MGLKFQLANEGEPGSSDLTWKFAKWLAAGSILVALIWWSPIPIDQLAQVVLLIALPMLLMAVAFGLISWDMVRSTWNDVASGDFSKRVEKNLNKLREQSAAAKTA